MAAPGEEREEGEEKETLLTEETMDEEASDEDKELERTERVLQTHEKQVTEEHRTRLFHLKSLQGQLLDDLIKQVSDPEEPISSELHHQILSSLNDETMSEAIAPLSTQTSPPLHSPLSLVSSHSFVPLSLFNSREGFVDEGESPLSENLLKTPPVVTKSLPTSPTPHHGYVSPKQPPLGGHRSPLSPLSPNKVDRPQVSVPVPCATSTEVLMSENESLRTRIKQLSDQLDQFNNINIMLRKKVMKLQQRLSRYEEDQKSNEMLLNTLQSQLMLTVDRMKEQENENDKLCEELRATKLALEEMKHKNAQKKEDSSQKNVSKLDEEKLQKENSLLQGRCQSLEDHVKSLEEEVEQLQLLLKKHKHQEDHYDYALQFMDGELKRLRFIKNQTEPYPTQYTSYDQSRTPPPRHTPSPPRHTPSPPLTTVSLNPQRDYRPLTRKRWLETSEGGLIFGTPPQAQPTQSPPLKNTVTEGHIQLSPVDKVLDAIKNKRVTTSSSNSRKRKSLEERVEERLRIAKEAEDKLSQLHKEKVELESFLQRGPPNNKITADYKRKKKEAEHKLEQILKEIGAIRMIIRNPASWKV